MPHYNHEEEEVQSLFFRTGGVPFESHVRVFALHARVLSIIRLLRNWVKQSRGGDACEEFAVSWCGFALETGFKLMVRLFKIESEPDVNTAC
jgi:hypothetical protein